MGNFLGWEPSMSDTSGRAGVISSTSADQLLTFGKLARTNPSLHFAPLRHTLCTVQRKQVQITLVLCLNFRSIAFIPQKNCNETQPLALFLFFYISKRENKISFLGHF